jgi:hypothetical protein
MGTCYKQPEKKRPGAPWERSRATVGIIKRPGGAPLKPEAEGSAPFSPTGRVLRGLKKMGEAPPSGNERGDIGPLRPANARVLYQSTTSSRTEKAANDEG